MAAPVASPTTRAPAGSLIDSAPIMWLAAGISLAVAWVHLAYWQSHWEAWWGYGVFFIAVGAGQALFAPVLLKWPSRPVMMLGVAGNLAVVVMYVISRTAGVPFGPHAEIAEHVEAVDLATTGAEIVLAGLLLGLLGPGVRRWTVNLLLACGIALWALRLTNNLP